MSEVEVEVEHPYTPGRGAAWLRGGLSGDVEGAGHVGAGGNDSASSEAGTSRHGATDLAQEGTGRGGTQHPAAPYPTINHSRCEGHPRPNHTLQRKNLLREAHGL